MSTGRQPQHERNATTAPSRTKTVMFSLVLACVPLALLGGAEWAVRVNFDKPVVDDPYLNIGAVLGFYEITEIDGVPYYDADLYRGRAAPFPVDKANGARKLRG